MCFSKPCRIFLVLRFFVPSLSKEMQKKDVFQFILAEKCFPADWVEFYGIVLYRRPLIIITQTRNDCVVTMTGNLLIR